MPIPGFLKDLLAGGAAKLGEAVKGIIDESKYSAEERAAMDMKITEVVNKHTETMATLALQEAESYLKDTQNARDTNTRIQESANASWLAKNIAYCLDILFVLSFISMLVIIIFKIVPEDNKELFYTAFGGLCGYVATIINFHRGTSKGSEEKTKHIASLQSKS